MNPSIFYVVFTIVAAVAARDPMPLPRALRCATCKQVALEVESQYQDKAVSKETFKVGHRMQNVHSVHDKKRKVCIFLPPLAECSRHCFDSENM